MQAVIGKMLFSVLLVWSICVATTVASAQANPVPSKFPLPTAEREPDPEEIVQGETNLVRLITDQLGEAVTGLKKESFKVYEDQPLASSTRKKLPRVGDSFSIAVGSMMGGDSPKRRRCSADPNRNTWSAHEPGIRLHKAVRSRSFD